MPGPDFHFVLASGSRNTGQAVLWVAVLMAVVVLGGALVIYIRKRSQDGGSHVPALGLSLADLRQMRAEGRLTEEEFERAKAMVIGELGGKVDRAGGERIRVDGRIVDGELRAREGFDLTGQPLPDFGGLNNTHPEPGAKPPEEAGESDGKPEP